MEELFNEIESRKESKIYTPESLAWDLLVGDIDPDTRGIDEFVNNGDVTESDKLTDKYQILITIFMELLFGIAKLNFYAELEKNGGNINKKFIPKYKKFDLNSYVETIDEKMQQLGFFARVDEQEPENLSEESKQDLINMINDRYCRVVLRYNDKEDYFDNNDVPEDVYYHMILNGLNKKAFTKLEDIFSIINLNGKVYKISFAKV